MDPNWSTKAAVWNPGVRMNPRFSPSYQSNVVVGKATDNLPDYIYRGSSGTRCASGRSPVVEQPYRPFGYVEYYKPVTPPIPVVETTPVPVATTGVTTGATVAGNIRTCVPKTFYGRKYRVMGYVIVALAVMTLAFEVADVIVAAIYRAHPCRAQTAATNTFTIPWFFSWVVPGIWGSIPIIITGILAISARSNYGNVFQALAILSSLSAFFFAPAIIAINAAELGTFFQYCNYTTPDDIGTTTPYYNTEKAKFALPIVLIVLGILLFLLLLYLTYLLCKFYDQCVPRETIYLQDEKSRTPDATSPTVVVPVQPKVLVPIPDVLPQTTMPPPPPRDIPGRVVFLEGSNSGNNGNIYSKMPGCLTNLPTETTTIVKPTNSLYYWK